MTEDSRIVRSLFFLGVVAIPFDAVPGLGFIGELAHEASFYFFFAALAYASLLIVGRALARSSVPATGSRWVLACAIALLGCIALTALVNLPGVASANFHGRTGLPKFVTSALVIGYGLALAWLTTATVNGRWYERLVIPASISAAICVIVCVFEWLDLHGLNTGPFQAFYRVIHAGSEGPAVLWDGSLNLKELEGWDKRLRSVSFEPPAFGNFAGLIWPWLACGVVMARGTRKAWHIALLALFTALIAIAQARTGWLLLACDIMTFAVLWVVFLPRGGRPRWLWMAGVSTCAVVAMAAGGLYYALSYDRLVETVVNGQSVSDLTRFAYQITALRIFFENPVFGVGLGQFAFKTSDFMPSWGLRSSEIHASLIYPDAPWPSTYSLYARIGAEMGLVGLITWLGIWIQTACRLHRAALAQVRASGQVSWPHFAIFMSIAAILISGFTTDTFRTPLIWITLGAAADAIGRASALRRPSAVQKRSQRAVDARSGDYISP